MPPPIERTVENEVTTESVAGVIEWFLLFDERVAMIRNPIVEEVFQWKQDLNLRENENIFRFNLAEDRLAIGIVKAIAEHNSEQALHEWISKLLNALNEATRANEEIAESFELAKVDSDSAIVKANAIPSEDVRVIYLNYCWLEALCTAEIRVLGWIYKELYRRNYAPDNF